MEGDVCVKCITKEFYWDYLCINKDFGCVKSFTSNCLKCDNSTNFDSCNQCAEGYLLDEYERCSEIEEES